jgi:hypothetical protein
MSTVGNGTTGASGTGTISGYNLVLSYLFIVFFLFLYGLNANTSNPYTTIMLLIFTHNIICFIIFRIKIYHKILKTLTYTVTVTATATIISVSWRRGGNYQLARAERTGGC